MHQSGVCVLLGAVTLGLLVGCGAARRDAVPPPASAVVAEVAEDEEVVETPCALAEAHARTELRWLDERLAGWIGRDADAVRHEWAELSEPMRRCIDAGRGSWMFWPSEANIADAEGRPIDESAPGTDFPIVGIGYEVVYVPDD